MSAISEVDEVLMPLVIDEAVVTFKNDVVDVTNVAELVILVYDNAFELCAVGSPSKIKEKLSMNIVRSYHIHRVYD